MKDLNKVILIGRLGSDPEIRYTKGGTAVCNISLATTSSIKRNGEWEDLTEWHRLVFWGKTAEVVGEYLSKGSKMYVEGRLQTRSWEDGEGYKRYTTEIIVQEMIMLDNRQQGSDDGNKSSSHNNDDTPPPF